MFKKKLAPICLDVEEVDLEYLDPDILRIFESSNSESIIVSSDVNEEDDEARF